MVLRKFAKSSWRIRLRCGLLKLQRANHMLLSLPYTWLSSRWRFVFCTVPDIAGFLQPLEDVIRCTLLPVLLGISPPNDTLSNLIALPPY